MIVCGCQVRPVNGNEVLQGLLNSDEEPISYYQETEYRWSDGESFFMKEWKHKDGRSRTEIYEQGRLQSTMIQTFASFHIIDYEAEQIYVGDNQASDDWEEMFQRSPRKWLLDMLQNVYDTHSLGAVKEATHLGRKVFVLQLNEDDNEGERTELWVDKESWLILKNVSESGEFGYVSEVIHLDLEPEISEELFELDIGTGFEVIAFDELVSKETMSLEEAMQLTNKPFLVPGVDYELVELTVYSEIPEDDDYLLEFLYRKADYSAAFSYTFSKTGDLQEAIFGEEEPITIRGATGWMMWDDVFNMIIFQENGFQYSIYFETGLTKEEAIQMIEEMEEFKDER